MNFSTVARQRRVTEQQSLDRRPTADSAVKSEFQQDELPIESLHFNNSNPSKNYQENYTATYKVQDNLPWVFQNQVKQRLEKFFSSQDFSILCLDFYILLVSIKRDDHFNLELLISKIVDKAKIHLLCGGQQNPQESKEHNALFSEAELTSMLTEIFINLSKNKLNIYSVRSIIYHPSFELNLHSSTTLRDISIYKSPFKAVGSYYINFSSSAINIIKRSTFQPESISKSQTSTILTLLLKKYGFENKCSIKNQIKADFERRLNRYLIEKDCDIMYNNLLKATLSWRIFLLVMLVVNIYLTPFFYTYLLENPWEIVIYLFDNFVVPILSAYFGMKLIKTLSENYALYTDLSILSIALVFFKKLINSDLQYIDSNLKDQEYLIKKNMASNNFEYSNLLKQQLILPSIKIKILNLQNFSRQDSRTNTIPPNNTESANQFNSIPQERSQPIETHKNNDEGKDKLKPFKRGNSPVETAKPRSSKTQQGQRKFKNINPSPTHSPNTVVFEVGFINTKYPSKPIYYKDLKLVEGRYGNNYYIYWDNNLLYNNHYKANIKTLKGIFNNRQEVKRGDGYNGIKKLKPSIMINKVPYIYELKSKSIASRVYGFIYPSIKLNRHIVIFCYYDNSGSLSNH